MRGTVNRKTYYLKFCCCLLNKISVDSKAVNYVDADKSLIYMVHYSLTSIGICCIFICISPHIQPDLQTYRPVDQESDEG